MCGIAGTLGLDGAPPDAVVLRRMIGTLSHRGPDGTGIRTLDSVGLAHARLSIIDLTGGGQPMSNEDDSLWVTFNGEIFNYVELRRELLAKGHRFKTSSDTEVILHLYEELGEDCVRRLNGQWAFALWDGRRRRLFLSRDRMGVRPLFYAVAGGWFLFASEGKAILTHPAVPGVLDLEGLDQYFTFRCTIPPRTAFKGVNELAAGHSLVVEDGSISLRRYYEIEYPAADEWGDHSGKETRYADQLLDLLTDAVRIRLRADVPVGAYLSGGLDSTVITALVKKISTAPLKTFSIRFADAGFDESRYQKEAVEYLGVEHHEVHCSESDIGRAFPGVIWQTEKPLIWTAPAPLYLLSKVVRENGYKVVLTGEGSDEILGGYDIFKEAKIRRFWAAHPESRLRPLLLKKLYPYLTNLRKGPVSYLKAFFRVSGADTLDPFFSHLPRWEQTSRIKDFFSNDVREQLRGYHAMSDLAASIPARFCDWHPFCQAQFLETSHLMPGYILSSQGDRVAMAHAVEGRFPFLDHRVVEFAASIPPNLKMKVLNEKYVLKHGVNGLVPKSVKDRVKQPYRAPESTSFMCSPAREYVEELLSQQRIQRDGVFNPAAVCKLLEKVRRGQAGGIRDNMALVGIVSTQLLIEQFINHPGRSDSLCKT